MYGPWSPQHALKQSLPCCTGGQCGGRRGSHGAQVTCALRCCSPRCCSPRRRERCRCVPALARGLPEGGMQMVPGDWRDCVAGCQGCCAGVQDPVGNSSGSSSRGRCFRGAWACRRRASLRSRPSPAASLQPRRSLQVTRVFLHAAMTQFSGPACAKCCRAFVGVSQRLMLRWAFVGVSQGLMLRCCCRGPARRRCKRRKALLRLLCSQHLPVHAGQRQRCADLRQRQPRL